MTKILKVIFGSLLCSIFLLVNSSFAQVLTPEEAEIIYHNSACKAVGLNENGSRHFECCGLGIQLEGTTYTKSDVLKLYTESWDVVEDPQPIDTSFDEELNGLLTVLAINFESNNNFGHLNYNWIQEGNLMVATPVDMLRFDSPTDPHQSPMLTYNIRITTGGAYYLWVKGVKVSGTSDSFHFGIDGVFLDSMTLLDDPWSNLLQDYENRAMITLNPGDYVFNVWMREDGTKLEEFVFAKDPNWTP